MDKSLQATKMIFISSLFLSLVISSSAQTCSSTSSSNRVYSTCTALPVLNSFLHWDYHQTNRTVDIAYRHSGVASNNWVAWALNINDSRMIGAQCLVAFRASNGNMRAYTSPIANYQTTLAEGPLSFNVSSLTSEFTNNETIIFATLHLPPGNSTSFNQVWQVGPLSGDTPGIHDTTNTTNNLASMGTVDFSTGGASLTRRQKDRNIHAVLNTISWGVLMPLGAIAARYLKKSADPAWYYIHLICQTSAYTIRAVGWAIELKRGEVSSLDHSVHRNIGITLFCLGTLQVFALFLRPNKNNRYRCCWNFYHHVIGYAVIILSIINIFLGFETLNVAKRWKWGYIGVLIFFGVKVVSLECCTFWKC